MATVNPIQVETFLKGIHYPAERAALVKRAEANGATDEVRGMLMQLPDQTYGSTIDVTRAIGVIDAPTDQPKKVATRSNPIQVEKFLKGADYPASRSVLIDLAKKNSADERTLTTLSFLPDQTFASTLEVSAAIGRVDREAN